MASSPPEGPTSGPGPPWEAPPHDIAEECYYYYDQNFTQSKEILHALTKNVVRVWIQGLKR
jgi:hypothetical protein